MALGRQDLRLDTFLRRQLSLEEYERVCGAESCVLFSPEEKRVHRYVILGHRQLYSTEFAPKKLKVLLQLDCITAVQLLHDLPEFLSGEERQNTVHVQIQYRRVTHPRKEGRFLKRSLPSPPPPTSSRDEIPPEKREDRGTYGRLSPTNRAKSPLLRHRSSPDKPPDPSHLNPSPPGKAFSAHSNLAITHHSPGRPGSDLPESPLTLSPHPLPQVPSPLQELPLISIKQNSHSPSSKSKQESTPLKLEPLTSPRDVKPLPMHTYLGSSLGYPHKAASQPNLQESTLTRGGDTSNGAGAEAESSKSSSDEMLSFQFKPHPPQMPPCPPSRLGGSTGNLSRLHIPGKIQNSNSMGNLYLRQPHPPLVDSNPPLRSTNSVGNLYSLGSVEGSPSQALLGSDSTLNVGEEGSVVMATLDLYILNQLTHFYHLLNAVWLDFEIDRCLQLSLSFSTLQVATSPKPYEQFSQQFCTLKREMLTSQDLHSSAELAQELSTACHKYFCIKKMFWEDSDLLEFCCQKLQTYLSRKSITRRSQDVEDCIEYVIILLELLYNMLRQSHTLRGKKLSHLTTNDGHTLFTLTSTITGGFPLLEQANHTQWVEFTEKVCGVLYEITTVLEQTRWPSSSSPTHISTASLIQSLLQHRMRDFVKAVVEYVSGALSSAESAPQLVVGVYHVSVVLHAFLSNSPAFTLFTRKHFYEEFKYYLPLSKGDHTLPGHTRLSTMALDKLRACKSIILTEK